MSLFQCDGCGCIENTACTFGYVGYVQKEGWSAEERIDRGLDVGGKYCSACWDGKWHGRFERRFYEKGSLITAHDGGIAPRHNPKDRSQIEKFRVSVGEEEKR